ncbi:MAG: hypothetical protein ABR520_03360, partial [Mycobacteriales bacterium]
GLYRSARGATGRFAYMAGTEQLTHPAASNDPVGRTMLTYGPYNGDAPVLWAIVQDAGLLNGEQPGGDATDLVGTTTGRSLNATNTLLNGVYRSDDNGATWQVKATPQSLQSSVNEGLGIYPALGYGVGVQAYYNLWIVADPVVPDQIYFGLEEVFQSVRGTGPEPTLGYFDVVQRYWDVCGSTTYLENIFYGQSCPEQTPYYGGVSTHPDQHVGVAVRTAKGVRLYTGNDGGFYREDSHALPDGRQGFDNDTWVPMNTLASVQPWRVARKPDGEYLTALQDNGGAFFKPGQTSTLVTSGDGVNALATTDPDTWYYTAQGGVLWVTTDHGKNIREMQPDLTGAQFLSPVVMDPTDENHLVETATVVAETTKGPNTMTTLDPLLYTVVTTDWVNVYNAGASPQAGVDWNSYAAAVRGTAVYSALCGRCRNSLGDPKEIHATVATNVKPGCTAKKATADCWHTAKGKGLPHSAINGIAIDPKDVKTIYVAINEYSLVGFDKKTVGSARVMVSHNAGESFTDITGNLPQGNMRDLVVRDGQVIVGGDQGLFVGNPKTKKWSRLGTGLPPTRVFDLSLDRPGRHLTISVYGRGVWDLDFGRNAKSSSEGPGAKGEPVAASAATPPARGSGFRLPALPAGTRDAAPALAVMVAALGALTLELRRKPMVAAAA